MFNFLGTIREAQWRLFRDWTLNERRAVAARIRCIEAELNRIGIITVAYKVTKKKITGPAGDEDLVDTVTEERVRFSVSSGSTLEKLVQSYIACGGNPLSFSLWLQPDIVQFTTKNDPGEDDEDDSEEVLTEEGSKSNPYNQPYGGVIAPRSTDFYGSGGRYPGSLPTFLRDPYVNAGFWFKQSDSNTKTATRLDYARRWVQQNISEMTLMEQRIMKLMDLREQLNQERDTIIQQAIGGSVSDFPIPPDPERYATVHSLPNIVDTMNNIFYETDGKGEPAGIKIGTKDDPQGIATFDTLFGEIPGTDPWTSDA